MTGEELATGIVEGVTATANVGVVVVGADDRVLFVNAGMAAMLGVTPAAMVGHLLAEFTVAEQSEPADEPGPWRGRGIAACFELRLKHADGSDVWLLVDASPHLGACGMSGGSLGLVVDITARKCSETALRRAQERLAAHEGQRASLLEELYAAAPDAIVVAAPDGRVLLANPAAERLFGYELGALMGLTIEALLPGRVRAAHIGHREGYFAAPRPRAMGGGRNLVALRSDGTEVPVDISLASFAHEGRPAALAVIRDITERKRMEQSLGHLEEQLRQSQKLQAVGVLAGGVAHDFNNLLSVILAYSQIVFETLAPEDPMAGDIDEIRTAAQRATELTRQLLAFGRKQVLRPRVLNLNHMLLDMQRMLGRVLGDACELSLFPADALWSVYADLGQMEQVIVNLVVNARDAMEQGGRLTIETSNVTLDAEYAATHVDVSPGPHVMLAASDTGRGMDAATRERIFEPFFTTKDRGKGTGLGLSTVHGIVKQSGGHIWVYSEPGKGTTFKIYLPRARADVEPDSSVAPPPLTLEGSETVLLVEDDEQVRSATRAILRKAGYAVLEAANGGEAFLVAEKFPATIHLLLTDVVMPRMSGRQVADRLAPLRPEMRVLYMSGYTENAIVHHGVLESGIAFLQKPITPDALRRKIREVLDAGPPVGSV